MKVLLAFTFTISIAFAEVRVFQYLVLNNVSSTPEPSNQLMTTTLNPTAFVAYHGGEEVVSVDLLRTWMCYGNTSGQDLCPPPMSKLDNGVLP